MKKILALTTALVLALSMLCVGALADLEPVDVSPVRTDAALADFNGTWNAYLAGSRNAMLPVEFIGIEFSLIIEDGKATLTMVHRGIPTIFHIEGDVSEGVLAGDAVDETVSLSISLHEDGVLSSVLSAPETETLNIYYQKAEDIGGTLTASASEPGAAPADALSIHTDAAFADFNGTWNAHFIEMYGTKLPIEALGQEVTLIIEDTKVILTLYGVDGLMEGSVSDDVLTATADDGTVLSFSLHEDGTLSSAFDENITVYFQKVD